MAAAVVALVAALVVALAGCSAEASTGPSGSSGPSTGSSSAPEATALGPPATLSPGATPLVPIDPALLRILPDEVDGLSVNESGEGDASAEANPSLGTLAEAAVGAIAIDPAKGNFVIAIVVRLRPGVLTDDGFRSWRDNYDEGVCAGSGVIGNAEADIGGRTVYVGTCGNGFHTYHAWIPEQGLLISASTGGDQGLGELLFGSLRL